MTLYTLAWLVGGLATLSTAAIILQSPLKPRWKVAILAAVALCIAFFVVPQQNPWVVFLGLLAFNIGVRPLKSASASGRSALVSVALAAVAVFAAGLYLSDDPSAYTGSLVADIRANVARRWEQIVDESARLTDSLGVTVRPASKAAEPAPPPKRSVRRNLARIRELLLPVDCRDILSAVDELDVRIAEMQKTVVKAEGERVRHPDEAEKYDARIAEIKARKATLEQARAEQAALVIANLRDIGLSLPGNAAERCVFPVNVESLIDNAVVAKDIAVVVENLGRFLDSEDLATAKRYFGMYLVMIDVQAECFRQYLEKSEDGEWRRGINDILRDAEAAARSDEANAAQPRFKEAEREIFRHNAETNRRTIEAGRAYLDLLRQHEEIIRGKLREAERIREVAQSSWNTVSLASDLRDIVKTSHEAFESLLSLELPPLALFDDAALQAEFDAITRKLKKD